MLLRSFAPLAFFTLLGSAPASAQCPAWSTDFPGVGADAPVRALAVFDDGSGPALYAGGDFTRTSSAVTAHVARWDGTSWSALGAGLDGPVSAMTVFDDGAGPALYVAGAFATAGGSPAGGIAKWDGAQWSAISGGTFDASVFALAVHDDGSGLALFAAGTFTSVGSVPAARIARFDGASWSALSSGLTGPTPVGFALASWDDGMGPALFVGGSFDVAGGVPAHGIAKWQSGAFSALSTGVNNFVAALAVFDDGTGARLWAGGNFFSAGGVNAQNVARWDGTQWSAAGSALSFVEELAVVDVGSGPALYAGGSGNGGIRRWTGSTWATVGGSFSSTVQVIVGFDAGSGTELYAGGTFTNAPAGNLPITVDYVARWNAVAWSGVGPDRGLGMVGSPTDLVSWQPPSGPRELVAAGSFTLLHGESILRVARWDGSTWSALGAGLAGGFSGPSARTITEWDDGTGNALYVGGFFTQAGGLPAQSIARWNGSTWSALASGLTRTSGLGNALCSAVFDDGSGPALYVGGIFDFAGGVPVAHIARWDGSAWSDVGGGVACSVGGCIDANMVNVTALCVFDDGAGPALYAAGVFSSAGGVPASHVARWDGTTWSALAGGVQSSALGSPISALAVHDDGSGPALYASGHLSNAGEPVKGVARWDGTSWSAVGAGLEFHDGGGQGNVLDLVVFDDGGGPRLYATGGFRYSGGASVRGIARWDGVKWSELDGGLSFVTATTNAFGQALAVHDDASGDGPSLYVGGAFTYAGDVSSQRIARWKGCGVSGTPFCFGDGADPGTTPCPCANFGATGRGCANSIVAAGALLASSGTTAVDPITGTDTIVLAASGIPAGAITIFLQGSQGSPSGVVFGDGVRCVGGALLRLAVKTAVGGAAQFPAAGDPSVSQSGGVFSGQGVERSYQVYYRDGPAAFCPPATFNVTNGVRIYW